MTEEQLRDVHIYFPLSKLTRGTIVPETIWEYFYGEGFAITTRASRKHNHGQLVQLGELCNEGYYTIEKTADGWVWLGECYRGSPTPVEAISRSATR